MKTKKEKVLEVASRLFAEQGFEKTSMANICEAANVSKGLVYHHFKSKNEILLEIFSSTTRHMMEMNESGTEEVAGNRIVSLIERIFSQLEHNRFLYQLNVNVMFQPSSRKLLKTQIQERASILFTSVNSIFDEIDPEKSELLSYMFIAEIDGIVLDYLSVFDTYPLHAIKELLIKKYENLNTGIEHPTIP
ncbi:MAG: TetR/AcrR family transcriptional regulator [Bacteroidota bacterium]